MCEIEGLELVEGGGGAYGLEKAHQDLFRESEMAAEDFALKFSDMKAPLQVRVSCRVLKR